MRFATISLLVIFTSTACKRKICESYVQVEDPYRSYSPRITFVDTIILTADDGRKDTQILVKGGLYSANSQKLIKKYANGELIPVDSTDK